MSDVEFGTVTVASGAAVSGEIDLTGGWTLVGAIMPSALTSTGMGVSVSNNSGGTFVNIKDGASDYSLTVAASKAVYFDPKYTNMARYAKFTTGTSEAATRTLTYAKRQL